ncbi:sulfurtransferase complex subunit TusC [Paraglaciecola sp.]|uniref:sulfurtransferase complex subunit TusC n=1 Tax=Paraglaciecola sp. TaxID=1920173 RepID=UPI003EF64B3F
MTVNNPVSGVAIVNQTSPFGTSKGQESLELALALSNFGQEVSLFFIDDGVFQLLAHQSPENIQAKAYFKTFSALEFYDIENIYVCEESLKVRNLDISSLCIPVTLLSHTEHAQKIALYRHTMVF